MMLHLKGLKLVYLLTPSSVTMPLKRVFFLLRPLIFISGFNLFDRFFSESGLQLVSVQEQYFCM